MATVTILPTPLDPADCLATFPRSSDDTGAVASFCGYVRGQGISALALEHYPGMTEASILRTIQSASRRWPIQHAQVVHRVGELLPGDPIVWVGVSSSHRSAAFSACEFIMDYLKVSAPLWKRERDQAGQWHWVEARDRDFKRAQRWGVSERQA